MNIRIFIIDEHRPSREILSQRLASFPDLEVIGGTEDGEVGLRQIEELQPDLVLIEVKMRNVDGMDICRRACTLRSGARVAILTSYLEPEERRLALQAGADGYFLKEVDTLRLAQQIKAVARIQRGSKDRVG